MQPDSDHPHPVIGAVAAHAVAAIATAAVTVVEEVTGSKIATGRPCQTEAIFLRDMCRYTQGGPGAVSSPVNWGIWTGSQVRNLTWFHDSRNCTAEAFIDATAAWEEVCAAKFNKVESRAEAIFAVVDASPDQEREMKGTIAMAFFPRETGPHSVVCFEAMKLPEYQKIAASVLRHEIGHILGWRHEHNWDEKSAEPTKMWMPEPATGEWTREMPEELCKLLGEHDHKSIMNHHRLWADNALGMVSDLSPLDRLGCRAMYPQGLVPANVVVLLWPPGTTNPIMPDGWQLLEQQQDRFALGGITAAATAIGGSPTHSHTLNGSTQPDGGHSHGSFDGSFGVYDGWGRGGRPAFGIIDRNGRNAPSLRTSGPDGIHTHTFAATTSTVSNIPDFIKLPFIASNRDKTMIPERAIIACRTDSLNRPGWLLCDGQNGTPDLRDRFVRGSNTGFGETGAASSTTHKHDWSATTSTDGNHCHTSLGDSGCYKRNVDNGGLTAIDTNGRDVPTLNTSSNVVHNHGLTGSTQVAPPLPPFWSVAYFMRQPGAGPIHCLDDLPEGVILMFQGAPEAIPRGWALCDGKDGRLNLVGRFLRGSSAAARPDCPGGADATVHAHAVDETRMVGSGQHSHNTFDPGYGVYMRKIVGGDHRGISVIDANGKNPAAFVTTADGVHGHAVTGVKTAEADSMPPFFAILFLQRTPQQP